MLKKKHICIGGILLCISNYLFSLLFAVADLSLSKLVQIPRAPGELQANISRASELLQRSTIDFVNLLEQNFPYLSFALALAEEEREIVPDLLLSPESDVEDEFEQNFPRLSIALALAEEEREIVPDLLLSPESDVEDGLEQNFPYLSFALALAEEEREIVPDLLLSPESDVEDEFEQNFPRLSIALALAEEEREIVPDLLLSPESDVEDGLVQKFSHLSIDPIPEIPVPIAEGVPEGEEDQSVLLEDFFPPEDTNCTATGMKKMQWRENFYVLKPFATRKVITMSTNPEFESLPKKPKKLFPGKAKKIEKMSSEREDLAGRQIRKTVIEIVLRHLEADPNLEEILSSEELFGFQYIVAPVLIKIDGQKYIASREIPDAVPLDLVTLECFNEEGRYIYEEIFLNEWEEILKNLETSEKSLHLCGIRHNDLYFKNILFAQDAQDDTDTGRTYIIDFDKAKIVPNKKESEIKDLETFRRRIAEARYK